MLHRCRRLPKSCETLKLELKLSSIKLLNQRKSNHYEIGTNFLFSFQEMFKNLCYYPHFLRDIV